MITAGQSGQLTITVAVDAQMPAGILSLVNNATLASNETAGINDSATSAVLRPIVTIEKSADQTLLIPGNSVTYELIITSVGRGTANNLNEDEIEAMFALADRPEVPLAFNPVVSPRDDGDREPLTIAATPEAEERLYRILEERQARPACPEGEPAPRRTKSGGKSCGAGAATLAVDPFGNVFPCVQWRRPVGNLHRQSIREIWTKSSELAAVRAINTAAGARIDRLPLGRKSGFCIGLAEELTGSPLAIYPAAQSKLEILERLEK